MLFTWDTAALALALLACLLRWFDRRDVAGLAASFSFLCTFIAKWAQRRRERAALASPAMRPGDRAAVVGTRS